ncbi:MAG: hypothetical protein ACK5B9_15610 [Flavobacteriia bacterium]
MKNFTSNLIVLLFIIFLNKNANASIIIAKLNKGNWLNVSTWNHQRTPSCGDTIIVPENIKIKLTEMLDFVKTQYQCEAIKIFVSGTISIEKKAILNLPEHSELFVDKFGKITLEDNKLNALKIDYQVLYSSSLHTIEGPTAINKINAESIRLEKIEIVNYKETFLINWGISKVNDFSYYELFVQDKHKQWISIYKQKSFGTSELNEEYKCVVKQKNYRKPTHFKLNVVDLNGNVQTLHEFKYTDKKIERSNLLIQISKGLFISSTCMILSKIGK